MNRIAIIGGGGSGLCAANHLLSTKCVLPIVFEQSDNVGGTWVYEDVDDINGGEPFSSIYKKLRTNLPKEVMLFPGDPYPSNLPSFLHHTDVRKYLETYAKNYRLLDHVRFRTKVTSVEPIQNGKWRVTSNEDFKNGTEDSSVFDAIVVCNGHYSIPLHPKIPGIEYFKDQYLHSHYYRTSDQISGPRNSVLVLGMGPSALDIALELSQSFGKVFLSHRSERVNSALPNNVHEIENIKAVNQEGEFITEDGLLVKPDLFLPCTGYKYVFPFLKSDEFQNLVGCRDRVVRNLYRHMFYIHRPTLCFIGIPFTIAPFPFIHQQCAYAARVFTGQLQLPSTLEMRKHTNMEIEQRRLRGESERYFHRFSMKQFNYLDELVQDSGFPPNPPYIRALYGYVMEQRRVNLLNYRNENFKILDDDTFIKV